MECLQNGIELSQLIKKRINEMPVDPKEDEMHGKIFAEEEIAYILRMLCDVLIYLHD